MWEGLWLLLALCGLRSRAARPYVFVLLANWLFIYLAIAMAGGQEIGYAAAIAFDFVALVACYQLHLCDPKRPRWVMVLIGGYAVSLAGQFAYWSADALGWYAGTELFWFARVVFTGQMLAVSYPGGLDLVGDIRRLRQGPCARSAVCHSRLAGVRRLAGRVASSFCPRVQDPRP